MIRYALRCGRGHKFEAWFKDSQTYDLQAARGEVACPHCGIIDIEKDVMAPAVRKAQEAEAPAETARGTVLSPRDKRQALLIEAMQKLRDTILAEAEYVGERFPEEARRLHHEEITPERAIYGEASPEEVRELLEEGVKVMPLPDVPKDRN